MFDVKIVKRGFSFWSHVSFCNECVHSLGPLYFAILSFPVNWTETYRLRSDGISDCPANEITRAFPPNFSDRICQTGNDRLCATRFLCGSQIHQLILLDRIWVLPPLPPLHGVCACVSVRVLFGQRAVGLFGRTERVFVVEHDGTDDDDVAGDEGVWEDGVLGVVCVEQGEPHRRHGRDQPRHRPQQFHDRPDHQTLQAPVHQDRQPQRRHVHRPRHRRIHRHVPTIHKYRHQYTASASRCNFFHFHAVFSLNFAI